MHHPAIIEVEKEAAERKLQADIFEPLKVRRVSAHCSKQELDLFSRIVVSLSAKLLIELSSQLLRTLQQISELEHPSLPLQVYRLSFL